MKKTETVMTKGDTYLEPKVINQDGSIVSRSSTIFSNEALDKELGLLNFGTVVKVKEQYGDIIKVEHGNMAGYMDAKQVSLLDYRQSLDIGVLELYPLFPETMETSYEFFLSHVGVNYDTITKNLNGLTKETVENGQTYLYYGAYDLAYIMNENQIADTIMVMDINSQDPLIETFRSQAMTISDDEKLFLTRINGFDVVIDLDNSEMKIIKS